MSQLTNPRSKPLRFPLALFLALGLDATSALFGGETTWKISAPFPEGSPARYCAERTEIGSWSVSGSSGDLRIRPWRPGTEGVVTLPFAISDGPVRSALEIGDGYLVGTDRGEWGGELRWYDHSGQEKLVLFEGNVVDIRQIKTRVVVLTGLTHLTSSSGSILVLERNSQVAEWQVSDEHSLLAAPEASTYNEKEGKLWIITSLGLQSFQAGRVTIELESNLSSLYANSIGISGFGEIYVGMRHAVARYSPTASGGFREEWLVPSHCTSFTVDEEGQCSCLAHPQTKTEIRSPEKTGKVSRATIVAWTVVALLAGIWGLRRLIER